VLRTPMIEAPRQLPIIVPFRRSCCAADDTAAMGVELEADAEEWGSRC